MLPLLLVGAALSNPPLYLTHHWHYHQPIYWPYESVVETENRGAYSFSVAQVHFDRSGPYTSWPVSAVQAGQDRGLEHLGVSVSLSGSLVENLNALESAGWGFGGWKSRWSEGAGWTTSLGNPRLMFAAFGYHHPLMALIAPDALRIQVELHRMQVERAFGVTPGPGMFPPECAFSPRMIPALQDAGVEWSLVDSIHLERAHVDYPYSQGSNLVPPNGADQWDDADTDWVTLQNIWAPSPVAAPWAYQPHQAVYVDPETGEPQRFTVVPAARYEGNEDARGGFGALVYDSVLRSYLPQNTDQDHPMLVVLHHDGDNYGAGVESYYGSNWQGMLDWLQANPTTFVHSSVQDYLDSFPPDPEDTLHVEDGAWSGADNGDAEFSKWNGDPATDGYSPDRHSWAAITAATNWVQTAEALQPHDVEGILDNNGSDTDQAWRWLLVGMTSCYWYWDNSEDGLWDSHPSRAANEAVSHARAVVEGGSDTVGPTLYPPQREPYNPGGYEWGDTPERTDFDVWTFVYDVSGLASVELYYRVDGDNCRDITNEVYASGGWYVLPMEALPWTSRTDPAPTEKADEYRATVDVDPGVLVDYYVKATDSLGLVTRSPILHVVVGTLGQTGTDGGDAWTPSHPTAQDEITIFADAPAALHWGVNGWSLPDEAYWPAGTVAWSDGKAVETPMDGPDADGRYSVVLGPFDDPAQSVTQVDFVLHYEDDSWSSPDQTIPIAEGARGPAPSAIPEDCQPYYRSEGWDGEEPDDWGQDTGALPGEDDWEDLDSDIAASEPGCGCGHGSGATPWALALALLGVGRRRRRSDHRR